MVDSHQKKIVIVGPSLKMGGIEGASVNIANSLADMDHQITYIALFRQDHFFEIHKKIRLFEPDGTLNAKKLDVVKSIFWLRKIIKQVEPNTVLAFNYFYAAIVRLSLIGTNISVYVSDRASSLFHWKKHVAIFNFIVFKFLPPSGVIAQTKIAADYKKRFFGDKTKIKVIPNALREIRLYPSVKRSKHVLAVGRLNDHLKGFDRLLLAFALIENKDWQLVFAGGGSEGNYLTQQAQELGIAERLVFLGKVKNIDSVYAESGIFVIPSRSEGFPNALCEARAAGLPCISFDFIAGPRELIKPGENGIIIPDGDIIALAKSIDFLIANCEERVRLGQNAMEIRQKLNSNKITNQILDFFD